MLESCLYFHVYLFNCFMVSNRGDCAFDFCMFV